jgi:uncharacterized membrane protein
MEGYNGSPKMSNTFRNPREERLKTHGLARGSGLRAGAAATGAGLALLAAIAPESGVDRSPSRAARRERAARERAVVQSISESQVHHQSRVIAVVYWATTTILALGMLVGGIADMAHQPAFAEVIERLGYPRSLMTILGFWKVLGGVTLLVPRFPRLKEWAYAGVIFEMTGAAASHVASGDHPRFVFTPILFALIALASWATRPQSRTLGALFAAQT